MASGSEGFKKLNQSRKRTAGQGSPSPARNRSRNRNSLFANNAARQAANRGDANVPF